MHKDVALVYNEMKACKGYTLFTPVEGREI